MGSVALEPVRNKIYLTRPCVNDLLVGTVVDLDVLIQSSTNPLVIQGYHWQFSFSLICIRFGGASCRLLV
jgi:hypothetical protein